MQMGEGMKIRPSLLGSLSGSLSVAMQKKFPDSSIIVLVLTFIVLWLIFTYEDKYNGE